MVAAKKYLCPKTTYKFASVWKIIMLYTYKEVHIYKMRVLPDFQQLSIIPLLFQKWFGNKIDSNIFLNLLILLDRPW